MGRDPRSGRDAASELGAAEAVAAATAVSGSLQSEALYRSIISTSHDAIFVQTQGGRIIAWNDAATQIYGVEAETALSSLDGVAPIREWQLQREDGTPLPVEELPSRRTLATGEACRDVVIGLSRGGERRLIRVSTSALTSPGEPLPYAVVVTAADITREYQAEAALRESEDLFRYVFDHSIVGKAIISLDGRFMRVNDALCRMVGYARDELESSTVDMCMPAEEAERARADRDAGRRGAVDEVRARRRLTAKDGSLLWGDVLSDVRHDGEGNAVYIISSVVDVTDQVDAAAQIRSMNEQLERRVQGRTAQLEAATRELESFVYSAAHDLRSPLRTIASFSEIVASDAAERLTESETADLQRVRAAAQRMAALLDHLMALARTTHVDLDIRQVDVTALAAQVCAEVCGGSPERRLELVIAPGLTAAADAAVLHDVLTNLVSNAWKFTARHEAARIEIGEMDAGGEQVFYVRDDGAGFDMTEATHLFGPFQRYHAAEDFPGDGIGLATVQRLIARHSGRVWAESAVEQGATFYFTLGPPAAQS